LAALVVGLLISGTWTQAPGQESAQRNTDSSALPLAGGFSATTTWTDPRGGTGGSGHPVPVTRDTGAFWFFDPANLELVVKTLDARTVNGRFWVFASGLTDVEVELEVRHVASGLTRIYRNRPFTPPQIQDVQAFDPRLLEPDLGGRRMLWIGAHPDDEVLAAPWLAPLCRVRGASCVFLVATRGEAGTCALPEGCTPDLATVRSREMESSAAFYGATLRQWNLPDGSSPSPTGVRRVWAETAGGEEGLVARLAAEIATVAPDWVLTFDPRHGSTGHADHRALGELVAEALEGLPAGTASPGPHLWRLASRALFEEGKFVGFVAPEADGKTSEASRWLAYDSAVPAGPDPWVALVDTARRHPSQFPPETLAALGEVPPERRRVLVRDDPGS